MEQAGVVADVVVYSGLLDACAKAGDLARAKEVFARTGFHWIFSGAQSTRYMTGGSLYFVQLAFLCISDLWLVVSILLRVDT